MMFLGVFLQVSGNVDISLWLWQELCKDTMRKTMNIQV